MSEFVSGLVSIITPLYNGKKYIRKTMDSVCSQTYTNWEMLIINDGSTDGSYEWVKEYIEEKNENRIRLSSNPKNMGICETRNRGLKEAKGQYIAFLDSDDLWDAKRLENQLSFLKKKKEEDEKAAFVFSSCRIIDENGNPTGQIRRAPSKVTYNDLLKDNVISCLTVLIDREIIPTDLCYMPNIVHEDYAAWLNVLKVGHLAYGCDKVLCSYRVDKGSRSGNKLRAAAWHHTVLKSQNLSFIKRMYLMICYLFAAVKKRV